MTTPLQLVKLDGLVRPNSYIVKLKEDVPKSEHLDLLNNPQVQLSTSCIQHEYHEDVYKGYAATLTDEELEYLLNCEHVESVTEDGICSILVVPNDSNEVIQQEFPKRDQEASIEALQDVDVYGLDTDPDQDGHGHGTHTAGTAVGRVFGEATSANVIAVKVMSNDGTGANSWIIAGINWAFEQAKASGRPSVVNMSIGGPPHQPTDDAVRNAIAGGLSFAIAAGNNNRDASKTSPGGVSEANIVGAVDDNNKKATFSNFGSPLGVWAPGVNILSAWKDGPNSAKRDSGTSMAAPRVAGYMAVALGRESVVPPNLTEQLKKNAKPVVTGAPAGTTNLLAQRW